MADRDYTRSERCTNEIPISSSPADCDAVTCNSLADVITEAGPRCYSCLEEYGGELVSEITRHASQPTTRPELRPFDFGSAMLCALDRLEKEGIL